MAFLYAGGYDRIQIRKRYWSDLKFMYHMLQTRYGYARDHIIVVYKDGQPEDNEMPVTYPASRAGLSHAFSDLRQRLSGNDLFFFMSNHGAGYDEKDKLYREGFPDEKPCDEINCYMYDEPSNYYEDYPLQIRDDYFAEQINQLPMGKLIRVFEQCYGGGFIHDLRGNNRVLLSASSEFRLSWGNDTTFDVFSYHFTAALNGATHDGIPVTDADENHDGRISILEAFHYAQRHDNRDESPQLEDSGDGIPVTQPAGAPGVEGWLSCNSWLAPW